MEGSGRELVPRACQREGHVSVEAFELARVARASDPERERFTVVATFLFPGELPSQVALLLGRMVHAPSQLWIMLEPTAPALDAACRFHPRDCRDQMRAGEVVRGRERLARPAVRRLLGYRRAPERAPDGHAPECPRRAAELPCDDGAVIIHASRS
jgi:hypothetical protein